MEPKQRAFSMWYTVAAMLLFFGIQAILLAPHPETVSYSEFKSLVKANKVSDLMLYKDTITGTLALTGLEGVLPKEKIEEIKRAGKGAPGFVTTRVEDPGLVPELEAAHIRFTGHVANPWVSTLLSWILPAVIFFGLWMIVMKRMNPQSGLMSIGKSRAKVYVEHQTGVTFDDIAGIDEARGELMEIVDFLKNPARYRRLGGKIPKGVLLVGAPGTGKTLLAKAVAGEAGVPFFSLTGSNFVEMFVGVGAARVRDLFVQAQAKAPSIVFIDELDAVGKARGVNPGFGGHDEHEQTLNQLLAELDGFDTQAGVIILAATNRPEILDPALLRPGRFDRQVVIDRPDLKGREKILEVHTRKVTLAPGLDLSVIAGRTPGFVGADLANLVNEAALHAAREGKDAVALTDFDQAIDRIVGGLERKSRIISPKEKEIVAHHEAGHALVAESREHADKVSKISIIPRGVAALGYTQQQPTEDRYLMTRAELLDRLDVFLGGRVAEEIIFGDVSTGAHDDLQRASDLARHMVTQYGMSDALGLGTFERPRQALFLRGPSVSEREYSEDTARVIDDEMRKLLEAARQRVRETLEEKRNILEALAKLLIEKEAVDRNALTTLLAAPRA
ncbi:MAG TPA: ATP-dependent zinc metalloprotease FtsH [Actinomycetota bacterium]|jgi:cell division protease FtsH|nr:ATP-dependent zinc metalloprotease FtsH [Gemmatimonadales bacterium]HTK90607.1 ATP-dependent zinc metalloprotease FtsH [Verrucomicrobiae bacterium]